jgi:hypothetical protein
LVAVRNATSVVIVNCPSRRICDVIVSDSSPMSRRDAPTACAAVVLAADGRRGGVGHDHGRLQPFH